MFLDLGKPHRPSAMAKLVGISCALAKLLVLDSTIANSGVLATLMPENDSQLADEQKKYDIPELRSDN